MTTVGPDREIADLRERLREAEETLAAIRNGEVDALVVRGPESHQVYTLTSADRPYRRLVEVMTEGAAMILPDATILYANQSLAQLVGRPLASVIGGSFLDYVPAAQHAAFRRLTRGVPRGRLELELVVGATSVPVLVSLNALEEPDVSAICLIVTDLTEQKKSAALLATQERLRAANEVLKEADRRKDEFLAMLAHELRNPLAPISTAVHLLRARIGTRDELTRPLEILARQAGHLTKLVDDLLEVSRITRGKVRLAKERVDAATVIRQAVEISRPLLDVKKVELRLDIPSEPIHLAADPTRLLQIFANLLNNAAKFTPEGGLVTASIAADASEVVFRVRDTGVGMSAELLPRIFDLFVQADHTLDRAQGGLGIGLTLVRGLVELHAGTVSAQSAGAGKGSELTVRLPRLTGGAAPTSQDEVPLQRGSLGARARILVVDDNADAAETLRDLLVLSGHDVRCVLDGHEALEAARGEVPDVVLLDIGLPGLDGFEVARRLRSEHGSRPVIVAVSGYGQDEARRRSQAAGFDHHLVKPIDLLALEAILERL